MDLAERVFTCRHVVDEGAEILHALRDADGDLQLLCGEEHVEGDARALQLGAMILHHPSIVEIVQIDRGEVAHRLSADDPWKVSGPAA